MCDTVYLPDGVIKTIVIALAVTQVNYCLSVNENGTKKAPQKAPKDPEIYYTRNFGPPQIRPRH